MSKASIQKEKQAPCHQNKARENPGFASTILLSELPLEKIQRRASESFGWMSGNATINNRISFNGILPGKQAVIQPKLDISHPGDDYEKEAGSVADTVMRMTEPQAEDKSLSFQAGLAGKPLASRISPLIQTGTGGASMEASSPSGLESRLNSTKNNGSPLPREARSFMENRFGTDFGHVKIHTDTGAVQMNKELNAQAFTHGNHIYFNSGMFDTASFSGKHLLAHELTHVVQQNAGMQRIHRAVTSTSVQYRNYDQIRLMTLTEFRQYMQSQADWYSNPALNDDQRERIRNIILFANDNIAAAFGHVGMWYLEHFLNDVSGEESDENVHALRSYASSVTSSHTPFTLSLEPRSVRLALDMGKDILKLRRAFQDYILMESLKEAQFHRLRSYGYVDDVINYYSNAAQQPVFQARNGSDFASFIIYNQETSRRPLRFEATPLLGKIRNFHRFEKSALDRLANNFGDTSKSKPLTLILHTALDHNGAFHRDPFLTSVITDNRMLTLMIEGYENIGSYQTQIGQIANSYGQNNLIDQMMFAGHGNTRVIELAGSISENRNRNDDNPGYITETHQQLDLDNNLSATNNFLNEVIRYMSDPAKNIQSMTPHHRVVFNACLTGSNRVVQAVNSGNPATASTEILNYISAHASLATYLQNTAGNRLVSIGANASFGTVGLMNSAGELDIISANDPDLTADKLTYAETGTEPTGTLRAALESWATNQQATIAAMQRRVARTASGWAGKLIQKAYEIIIAKYQQNGEGFRLVGLAVELIDEMKYDTGNVFNDRFNNFTYCARLNIDDDVKALLDALTSTTQWRSNCIQLALLHLWMVLDSNKQSDFMNKMETLPCNFSIRYTHIDYLQNQNLMVALLGGSGSAQAKFRLALNGVIGERINNPSAQQYLLGLLAGSQSFPANLNTNSALGGASTEMAILSKLGVFEANAGNSQATNSDNTDQAANVHLPGSTINTIYTDSLNVPGRVISNSGAEIRELPDTTSAVIATLNLSDFVDISGRLTGWYAIQYRPSLSSAPITAFVAQNQIETVRHYNY